MTISLLGPDKFFSYNHVLGTQYPPYVDNLIRKISQRRYQTKIIILLSRLTTYFHKALQ